MGIGALEESLGFSQSWSLGIRRFGGAKYKNRNRHGNPDANTKTCPDSNANANPTYAPTALIHSLKHYKVLHERNVILTIDYAPLPPVDPAERVQITPMSERFSRIRLRFGFMERPNVPR